MYSVVRRYTGAGPLVKAIEERRQNVEDVLRGIPGFRAYYAILTAETRLATITVCDEREGAAESTRRAAAWVRENVPGVSVSPEEIFEGEVILTFAASTT